MEQHLQRRLRAFLFVGALLAAPLHAANLAPAESTTVIQAIRGAITTWASAWQSQLVDDYLARYHPTFKPMGFTTKALWETERRQRLGEPEWIRVTLERFEIIEVVEDKARVAFWLHYARPGYADRTRKEILLRQTGQDWLIEEELNREVQRLPASD